MKNVRKYIIAAFIALGILLLTFFPVEQDANTYSSIDNKETLDINAEDYMYNETIEKTFELLQQKSLDIELEMYSLDFDSAYFKVQLFNKA